MSNRIAKAGIVCCSNGQRDKQREQNERLSDVLSGCGTEVVFGKYFYAKDDIRGGTALERAHDLHAFYGDDSIDAIFDISGGDIANEVLEHLDFDLIAKSKKMFWGYSDLTTLINAIYAKTGKASVLYQIKNLVYRDGELQQKRYTAYNSISDESLFDVSYEFVRGDHLEGVVLGGNIRCLLKLAGTEFFPDMKNKILLLEARSGQIPQMRTYLAQLKQMGVFEQVSGIVLGTFTEMEQVYGASAMTELVMEYAKKNTPIARTDQIGHGTDAKAITIGAELEIDFA